MNHPVLFLAYCRPAHTKRVLSRILEYNSEKIYVSIDAAESATAAARLEVLQTVYSMVPDAKLRVLNHESHKGCGKAVSEALAWFFSHEEAGIILEDDTIPHPSFFPFCNALLQRYKNEEKISMISGSNTKGYVLNGCSYDLSPLSHIWGWATWKRTFREFDYKVADAEKLWGSAYVMQSCGYLYAHKMDQYRKTLSGQIDSWGYRWEMCQLLQQKKCIIPDRNLIENIGFGPEAAHTKEVIPGIFNRFDRGLHFPLIHPVL